MSNITLQKLKMLRQPLKRSAFQAAVPQQTDYSTQVFLWPRRFQQMLAVLLFSGLFMAAFGLGALVSGTHSQESAWLALGLVIHVIGLMEVTGVALALLCFTQEVRFTFDSVLIHQVGRKAVSLPYNEYNLQWVADLLPNGNVRLLMLEHNRGCSIPNPPQWVRSNFREIARIQDEEGWYSPTV